MRNLVICCDGTWNTPDQEHDGVPVPTNVVRLYHAIEKSDTQVCYYHPGVGTDGSWWDKLVGGGMGVGLGNNVQSAYKWLGENYGPNDRLFLFGFSRGAYTARSLAGMITTCGLLKLEGLEEEEAWGRVSRAFQEGYRQHKDSWAGEWAFHFRPEEAAIHFVGVWDTVGALGVPDDLAILNLLDDPRKHSFHDTSLSPKIAHARHAVALDEMRGSFTPTLWTGYSAEQDVKQVWFPGVHCDVGGGYPEKGLADGALKWMIDEAESQGLIFGSAMVEQVRPDFQDVLHNSANGVYKLLRTQPRSIPLLTSSEETLHPSVAKRRAASPISQAGYRPSRYLEPGEEATLTIYARDPWNETSLYLEKDVHYKFTATGQWLDRSIKCGPAGTDDGNFQIGEIVHLAGTLWGKVEKLFQKATGNEDAAFKGTRREDGFPWFSLVGAVANGGNPKEDGTPQPHESFLIGAGREYSPTRSGYLYCFANDAWNFYDNNRGSVVLTVKRLP